jgi:iron complex transport system substrate-binding protein
MVSTAFLVACGGAATATAPAPTAVAASARPSAAAVVSTAPSAAASTAASAAPPTAATPASARPSAAATPATPTSASQGGTFPVTIPHKHGQTTIPKKPERVVSVGYQDRDAILALGVKPLGLRFWNQDYSTIPWATDRLGGFKPEVIGIETNLDLEAIAKLKPDVILGVASYMTKDEYDILAKIAPTIADHAGFPDGGAPWRDQLRLIGTALGLSDQAEQAIAGMEAQFAQVRTGHPEFKDKTAAVASVSPAGAMGAYSSGDIRTSILREIGFVVPKRFDELAGTQSYFSISAEQISLLDTNVLIWAARSSAQFSTIRELPTRPQLKAYTEGRELFVSDLIGTAFTYGSPLSIPYLLERLVPMLVAALDGNPATTVPAGS